jgi:hypothetical protein
MNVSAMSLPTSYGEVIKKITYSSAAAILLISALMLSYGMDLSTTLADVFTPLFFKDLFSAVRTPLRRPPKDEIDDGVTYGGHGWLRWRPVDSFFSAPRV